MNYLLNWSWLLLVFFAITSDLAAQLDDPPEAGPFNVALYRGAQWRNIGPFRGGRSVAVTGIPGQDQTYLMGSTGGGVWKTTDAGVSWFNISDGYFSVGSVGAIAVAPSDPNIIFVGTGEHAIRGVMTSHGDGVYRSTDGGRSWEHMGLYESRHISDIRIHPTNPKVVFVAVQGAAHGPSDARGVYRSLDGGVNWELVHAGDNPYTGAADLSMDPNNPRILFAAMWDHERKPWQIRSGGSGSGLYRSTDGGSTWQHLKQGLPASMGKIGVSVSPANSNVVYANIEAENGGVYRSDNGGDSWQQVNKNRVTIARAWYYTEIEACPQDEHTVYVMNAPLLRSTDGGRSFSSISNPHSDQHDLWINPAAPQNMILANDGGATITFNGGDSWTTQANQATGQFYRVIADNQQPYYKVYGGQQDYTAIGLSTRSPRAGISQQDWGDVAGGESAFIALDPNNPVKIYGGSYQGNISVYESDTREVKDIMAYPEVGLASLPRDMKYRFNWNAPIVVSSQNSRQVYHAAQKVLVTRDGGLNWTELSPDLTRNEKDKQGPGGVPFTNEGAGGENYNTISYLASSPHNDFDLWVGSDDGLVHITRDQGFTWQNVTPEGLEECLINSIEVSPHDPDKAYVVATRYRFNDFRPLVFMTQDHGATWTRITRGIGPEDFVRVVREDPKREGLLYAGTETGLYISYNNGRYWHRFQRNLPVCPINDLAIRSNDLIAATSGRGFWVLDDLSFLQESAGYVLNGSPQLFQPDPVYRLPIASRRAPTGQGQNPFGSVGIDYYLPARMDSVKLSLEILDSKGNLVRSYSSEASEDYLAYPGGPTAEPLLPTGYGIHRFYWDLRRSPIQHLDGVFVLGNYQGALVPPGEYTLRLKAGDARVVRERVQVLPDPRMQVDEPGSEITSDDFAEQAELLKNIENTVSEIHQSVSIMQELRAQMERIEDQLNHDNKHKAIIDKARQINDLINNWEAELVQTDQETFQDVINFPNRLNAELMDLHRRCDGPDPRVTGGARQRFNDLRGQWESLISERDAIVKDEMREFNRMYSNARIDVLILPKVDGGRMSY